MKNQRFTPKHTQHIANTDVLQKNCPFCSSEQTKKNGKNISGTQKMKCIECGKNYTLSLDYSDYYISTKDENCMHTGLDYVRLTAGKHCNPDVVTNPDLASYTDQKMQEIWRLYELLNHTNSSHYNIEFFGEQFAVSKVRAKQGEALHFTWQDHTIFQFLKPYEGPIRNSMNMRGQYWIIDVYGMFFSISSLSQGENTFFQLDTLKHLASLANVKYSTRIDFCIDIKGETVDDVVSRMRHKHKQTTIFKGDDDAIETYYIGKKTSENKYGVIRIYDKKKDIKAKKKQGMYADYMTTKEPITRFEVELRANFLNEIGFEAHHIFDYQKVMDAFNTFVNSKNIQTTLRFEGAGKVERNYREFKKASKTYWYAQFDKVVERVIMNGQIPLYDLVQHLISRWSKAYKKENIENTKPYTGTKFSIPKWRQDYDFEVA